MKIDIFTDCVDENAKERQIDRYESLFPGAHVSCNNLVSGDVAILARIVDKLDATRFGKELYIVVCNIAPRADKKYKNGAPFCFVRLGNAIIIGTPDAFVLLKKLGIVTEVQETDVLTSCKKFLDDGEAERIARSQFRSFDYVPLLALWLFENKDIPTTSLVVETETIEEQIWWKDCFGNLKTTLTESNIKNAKDTKFPFYERMSDVPVGDIAYVVGSSGYGNSRFVELIKQGGSAADDLDLDVGHKII